MTQQNNQTTEKPLVQDQQPLAQVPNQQPSFQRAIDPNKLKAFLIQDNYKTKIKTILGSDSREASEIFKMEGLSWKEKFAEAKTRTSSTIDDIIKFEMDESTTADDMIRYYQENGHRFDKQEASTFRTSFSSIKNRIASRDVTQRSLSENWNKEQKKYAEHNVKNSAAATDAHNISVDIDQEIKHLTGESLSVDGSNINLFDDEDYNLVVDNISRFLGNDYTDESGNKVKGKYGGGNYRETGQALWALSGKITFPKGSGYTDDNGNWIEWQLFDTEDPTGETQLKYESARRKWTQYMMRKIDKLQTSAMKVTDFNPIQPGFKQAIEQQQQQSPPEVETVNPKTKIEGF